jgi:peptidoglycan/xylan/chitin deacetylase (PgdA/CDA1 family)
MLGAGLRNLALSSGAVSMALRVRRSEPLILMYHGVTSTPPGRVRNADAKHLHADVFSGHLETVMRYRRFVALDALVADLAAGRDVSNAVAITFDDGYENNFSVAAGILQRYRATATFFLSTGFIGEKRWIWTDAVEHALDRTSATALAVAYLDGPVSLATPAERILACRRIKAALKQMPYEQIGEEVGRLQSQLGIEASDPIGDYRFMNWAQARELARAGFGVGAHTVNHAILSRLPIVDATREILQSRDHVEHELGTCSRVFAYPNGKAGDYTDDVRAICQRHFDGAVTTVAGFAAQAERFDLRRCGAPLGTGPDDMALTLLRGH